MSDTVHHFMDHGDGGWHGSRDHSLPCIPCAAVNCAVNRNNYCSMPSRIQIGGDGKCKTGQDFKLESPPVKKPMPVDGD